MKELKLDVTIDDANLILEGLGNLPFAKVYALVSKIQEQASQQLNGELQSQHPLASRCHRKSRSRTMANDRFFLGTGWAFPPAFADGGGDVKMVSDEEDIHQSLQVLLATQPGERVMRDEFGRDLHSVLFEEADQGLVNSLTGLISGAILYHESRITLDRLDVSQAESEQGLFFIVIDYTVRSTNSRYNMVYPFYLNEAAVVSADTIQESPAQDPIGRISLEPYDEESFDGINEMEVEEDFIVT